MGSRRISSRKQLRACHRRERRLIRIRLKGKRRRHILNSSLSIRSKAVIRRLRRRDRSIRVLSTGRIRNTRPHPRLLLINRQQGQSRFLQERSCI